MEYIMNTDDKEKQNAVIITDGVHLMCGRLDPLDELHIFAQSIGLKREWFQDHPKHPHYDLTTSRMWLKAMDAGAEHVCSRTLILVGGYRSPPGPGGGEGGA